MNTYEPLNRSANGRYSIGNVELTSGDLIEWLNDDMATIGRVEHSDPIGYCVNAGNDYIPLSELITARYIGSGRL